MDQSPKPTAEQAVSDACNETTTNSSSPASVNNNPMSTNEEDDATGPENYDMVNLDQTRREFTCKLCEKKFSTKQALGGHQNAHKAQRASEKQVARDPDYNYHHQYSGSSLIINRPLPLLFHAPTPPLVNTQLALGGLGYYHPVVPPPHQQPSPYHHHHLQGYNNRPGLAFNNNNAAVNNHRPVLGFTNVVVPRFVGSSNVYGGLTLVPPRGPPSLMARVPSNYMRFAGHGGANMNNPPAGYVNGFVNFAGRRENMDVVEQEADAEDEAGLDLSLKLGYSNRD